MNKENSRYLMIIKPDGMAILSDIFDRIRNHQVRILGFKNLAITEDQAKKVYEQHEGKYYFSSLVKYLTMSPCYLIAIEGDEREVQQCKSEIREISLSKTQALLNSALVELIAHLDLQEKVTTDFEAYLKKFSSEFLKTFDGIHCSDADRGEREISVFFSSEDLTNHKFKLVESVEIIRKKIESSKSNGLISCENRSKQLFISTLGEK